MAETATAVVALTPEAVFDCSDVIGKVFDDINHNGYQDVLPGSAEISDPNIVYTKAGRVAAADEQLGERGLPNVRLTTPTGTIITTDEHGRFSVPCAELAGHFGTNFSLKVDTRSLPTGYRMTTENPRVMRLTAGIITEMNFGASISRIIDVDLTARAFASDGDGDGVSRELVNGLEGLLDQVRTTPSMVRITYFTNGEDRRVVRRRLDAVEDLIREHWRDVGEYRLILERTTQRLQ